MTMTKKTQALDLNGFIKEIQLMPTVNDTLLNLNTTQHHSSLFCLCLRYGQQGGGKLTVNQLKTLIDGFDHWQQSIIHNLSQLNNCVKNLDSSCVQADSKALVEFAKEAGIRMLEENTPHWELKKTSNNQLIKNSCFNIARYIKLSRTPLNETLQHNLTQLILTAYQHQDPNFIKETFKDALKKAKIPTQEYQQLSMTDI